MSRWSWFAPVIAVLISQAGEVERKVEDYPARMKVGGILIGAENLGPSVPTSSGGIFTDGYISIEVALFPEDLRRLLVSHSQFALRINGSKALLYADTPGTASASIKYPDWEQHRHLEQSVGVGNANVILGRPRAVERFPGDHRPAEQTDQGPLPRIDNPVARKTENVSIDTLVQEAALREGEIDLPASGCLYFPYRKKLKTIKSMELVYEGPSGAGSVRIP